MCMKVNLIYPATETHVRKHTDQSFHMVVETPAIYELVTRPFIESLPADKIEWVYNILEQYVARKVGWFVRMMGVVTTTLETEEREPV